MNAQQSAISAVFFDLDGTLLDHDHAASVANNEFWLRHGRPANMPTHEFIDLWEKAVEQRVRQSGRLSFLEHGPHAVKDLLLLLGRDVPLEIATAEFEQHYKTYKDNWIMYDDVIECLDALAHLHLGIISNGERETQIAKLEKFALTKRFATVVLAGEVGLAKPDPAIFQHACQKAGYAPEQCLFVGDNFAADVLGGSNARLLPVYLKRNPDHKQEGEHLHRTIATLRNLPSIVHSA